MDPADRQGMFYEDLERFLEEHELCVDQIDFEDRTAADNGLIRRRVFCKRCGSVLDGTYDLDEHQIRLLKFGKLGGLSESEAEALLQTDEGTEEFCRRVQGAPRVLRYFAQRFAQTRSRHTRH
jgi:hypothetical protein